MTILDDFLSGGPITSVEVLDCHMHLGPALYMLVTDGDGDSLVKRLDELGIQMACVSHSVSMVNDWKTGNDLLIETVRKHPERIFGYTVFNPNYPSEMAAELDRGKASGLRGLKIHPDFHQIPADNPLYDLVYERASDENRLILCHYGAGQGPRSGSQLYKTVIDRFPDMPTIMAHSLPNVAAVDTAVEYFGKRERVYFDLANAFQPGVIEYAVKRLGAERLLYGSDGCWGAIAPRLGLVCSTDLPDETKTMILGKNLRNILTQCA